MTRRDPKKGKPISVKKYYNIGAIDAPMGSSSFRNSASAFSITNMASGIQNQASKLRIKDLRKNFNNLLRLGEPKAAGAEGVEEEDPVSNPFKDEAMAKGDTKGLKKTEQTSSALSLSVYCRPKDICRPRTAQVNIYKGLKGLAPPVVGDEAVTIEEPKIDTRIADMKPIEGVEMIARTGTANARLEIDTEMQEIKHRLAIKGCHIDMNVLRRAM